MRLFWRICHWAAIGLCIVALSFVLQYAAYQLKGVVGIHDALNKHCGFAVIAHECRGFAGAKVVAFLLNLPLLVFFFGPIFLAGVLIAPFSNGPVPFHGSPAFAIMLTLAGLWFVLGMLGILRRAALVIGAIRSHLRP